MFCTRHFKIFKSSTATNLRFSLSPGAECRCSAPCRAAAYSSFYSQQHTRHERSDSFTLLSRRAVRKKNKKQRVCIAVSKGKTIHFHHTQIFNTQELRDALMKQEEDVADALPSRLRGSGVGGQGSGVGGRARRVPLSQHRWRCRPRTAGPLTGSPPPAASSISGGGRGVGGE